MNDPFSDIALSNTSESLATLRSIAAEWRTRVWPPPYDSTSHVFRQGDARNLSWIDDESVELIVTSPPYWNLKKYNNADGQLGDISNYEQFLEELNAAWEECVRVIRPGGRLCCVVGDVCVSRRKNNGRHWVAPLHSDIQVALRGMGMDNLAPIIWHKISNGSTEANGNGKAYYGKPYEPNGVVKNDVEYILFFRKPGYRRPAKAQRILSVLTEDEQRSWYQQIWSNVTGASTRKGHPAPYPTEIAYRLIRMFSFAGDTVFDPFSGTGSTAVAAIRAGRNSVNNEVDGDYLETSVLRAKAETSMLPLTGVKEVEVVRH